jgi:azurin
MTKAIVVAGLVCLARVATADVCSLNINATDAMRFEQQELQVDANCREVEVTLHHIGILPAQVMGHDWVLTKTADMPAVVSSGTGAGLKNNFQQPGDKRIIASTKIVGGGESTSVRFSTDRLERSASYSYFCSAPGHFSMMKGRFVLNAVAPHAVASNSSPKQQ